MERTNVKNDFQYYKEIFDSKGKEAYNPAHTLQTLDDDWLNCLNNNYHEGWVFGSLSFAINPLESGDMVSEQIEIFSD